MDWVATMVAPYRCAACDGRLGARAVFCSACAASVERFDGEGGLVVVGHYGGALASALRRLKYGNRPDLARPLGLLLADRVMAQGQRLGRIDMVVPVPMPCDRLAVRGYNQAALLARVIARRTSKCVAPVSLMRRRGDVKQASLGRKERLENLRSAFMVREPERVRGRCVLLVDDVTTTGATFDACAHALSSCGVQRVLFAAVAATPLT